MSVKLLIHGMESVVLLISVTDVCCVVSLSLCSLMIL